ncbi:MAG TPA: hypothetical protein VNQ79_03775 [Blastocatellia bacterium]|nr:hypothetical protein [Blastocatellia bacterium]
MHDCRKTEAQLIELVFDEAAGAQSLPAEIAGCPACLAQYQAMMTALRAFDQAAETLQPDESYWAGYEARLRAKLAEAPPPMRERFAGWLAAVFAKPLIPVAVTAALLLLIAASFIWQSRQRGTSGEPVIVSVTPSPQPVQTPSAPESIVVQQTPQSEIRPKRSPSAAPHSRRLPAVREPERRIGITAPDNLMAAAASEPVLPALAPERHFERAQLLLRAFRNSRFDEGTDAPDLAYEKRKSRELIYDNILLRREAAAKGNLPVEDVLSSLEPLLLDIANLPDKPAPEAVQAIRARVQKTEIVATLQIYSSGATRPGDLNQ